MVRAMVGALALALVLAPAHARAGGKEGAAAKFTGELTNNDPADAKLPTSKHKVHEFKMKAGQTVTIRLTSSDFDTFLRVEDSTKKELAFNDDDPVGGTLNSRLDFKAPKDDTYRLIVTAYDGKLGKYVLTVESASEKLGEFNQLISDFKEASGKLFQQYQAAKSEEEKDKIKEQYYDLMAATTAKFNAFAEANAGDDAGKQAAKMRNQFLFQLGQADSPGVGKILRDLSEKSTAKDVRGLATVALGENLIAQYEHAFRKKDKGGAEKLSAEAEKVLTAAKTQFGDVQSLRGTVGKQAEDLIEQLKYRSVGKVAKEISGEDLDGKKVKLSDYRGKVVVLYFWGSWCPPCRAMIPHEKKLNAKLAKAPFAMVGINTDSEKSKAKKFLEDEGITWTQVWDNGSTQGPISTAWGVHQFPTIYVLDANGVIRYRDVREEAMSNAVEELLKELGSAGK